MSEITLIDLIRNGTINAEIAATMWSIVAEQHSFVIVAVPRFAGKSTVGDAMLHCVPEQTPVHRLSGEESEMDQFKRDAAGGYLVVGEFADADHISRYIWGAPVRKVFDTMRVGYSLSTAMHAPSIAEAYSDICNVNNVADEDASKISYMVYIERMGEDEDTFWRRVAEVREVDRVVDGKPQGRILYRWHEQEDTFEQAQEAQLLDVNADQLRERARLLNELATSGRTSVEDLRSVVSGS